MADNTTVYPNILSEYASASYALTLYVVPKGEYQVAMRATGGAFQGVRNFSRKVIVAESAATALQITTLTIDTVPLFTQGTLSTTIRMSITNVRDIGLIEKLFATANIMNWNNPTEMHYLLEIRFLGKTEDNVMNNRIATVTLPIMFSNVNVNLEHSETNYQVEAVYVPSLSNDFSHSKIPENTNIDAGSNLGEFFSNLGRRLTELEERKVDNVYISRPPFRHFFRIDREITGMVIGSPTSSASTVNNQSLSSYNASSNQVSATNESTIQAFIDDVLNNVDEIQELMFEDHFVVTHMIEPIVIPGQYDPIAGKETYDIFWDVRTVVRRKYISNNTNEEEAYSNVLDRLRVVKLYDYTFTGLNSEVRNVNLDVNNLYHAKITQYRNIAQNRVTSANSAGISSNASNTQMTYQNQSSVDYEFLEDDTGTEILYVDDIEIMDSNYIFAEPKMSYNGATAANAPSNITSDSKLHQYMNDLHFIRNAVSSSFINAEIKIKGDPYWVLPPNKDHSDSSDPLQRDNAVENAAIIRFRHPNEDYYDPDAPFQPAAENSAFTGFYYIRGVTSTFQNGKFEQTLNGFRETSLSPRLIEKYLYTKGLN